MLTRIFYLHLVVLLGTLDIQASCLDELVSIDCIDCTSEQALELIEAQSSCSFSYNADFVSADKKSNIKVKEVSLQQAIRVVLGDDAGVKQRGRYVLITAHKKAESNPKKREFVVEGVVRNAETGDVLSETVVYVIGEKASTLTNQSGYYKLNIQSKSSEFGLSYSKQQFLDTIIVIRPMAEVERKNIKLEPRPPAPEKLPIRNMNADVHRPVEELSMVQFMVPEVQRTLSLNYAFIEDIPVQVSFLPSLSTNRLTGGQKTSTVSINLLSGYTAAVEGVEVGGVLNIVRRDVTGVQASGFGNVVGGKVQGVQAAGFFNNTLGSVSGAQLAGFTNVLLDTIYGVQASGFLNVLKGTCYGAQLGGFANFATRNSNGIQASGFMNVTKDTVFKVQIAGFGNAAGVLEGGQAAGFFNHVNGTVSGIQAAGFANSASDVRGLQIAGFANAGKDVNFQVSGFVNAAKTVSGLQLGIVNLNDSSNVSIGLLTFSRKGIWSLEVHADEIQPYNLSFRTGNRRFYNILQAGYSSYTGLDLWSYAYGAGTQLGKPLKRINYNIELIGRSFLHIGRPNNQLALNPRLDLNMNIRLGKKRPSIIVGPSINLLIADHALQSPESDVPAAPPSSYPKVYDPVNGKVEVDFWIGGKFGLRI
ncbi:MAG: hypothetical protein Salg2KO_16110 [Salibacteraceae bacterium]